MSKSLVTFTQESNIEGKNRKHTAIIKLPEEKWELTVALRHDDLKTERETAQIKICTPADHTCFAGSIQDIMAIPAIIGNARQNLMDYASAGFTDKDDEVEVLDSIKELDHLLELFNKTP